MRTTIKIQALTAAGLLILAGATAALATGTPGVTLGPGSTLELHGKSTLHDYESRATQMSLDVAVAPELPAGASPLARLVAPGAVKSLVFTVPVAAMKSDKDGLDKNLRKTLKADDYPNITFRMTQVASVTPNASGLDVVAKGELELAGAKRPVDIALKATPSAQGLVLEGQKALLMTEFGLKPPSMMLGTLKTADRVDIAFRLVVTPQGF